MKKFMYLIASVLILSITACGSDDDANTTCKECEVIGIATTFCDNGDGTMTTTILGQSETTDIEEGTTFEETTTAACSITTLPIPLGQ